MTAPPKPERIRPLWHPRGLAALMLDGPSLPGAACVDRADLFEFQLDAPPPAKAEKARARARRHGLALAICHHECPVRLECLATRLADEGLGWGVWGGRVFEPQPKRRKANDEAA